MLLKAHKTPISGDLSKQASAGTTTSASKALRLFELDDEFEQQQRILAHTVRRLKALLYR